MKQFFKHIFAIALASVIVNCCQIEIRPIPVVGDTIQVQITGVPASGTKSTWSNDSRESKVDNLCVYAYKNGMLEAKGYGEGNEVSLELACGYGYRIYAIANMGNIEAPSQEEDIASMTVPVSMTEEGAKALPMASINVLEIAPEKGFLQPIVLHLTRLVAKYGLSLDSGMENCSITATAISVSQMASQVAPFCPGHEASSVIDGDHASAQDLMAFNSGDTVWFYILENCQGVLLPDNHDSWAKIPDNIPGKKDLCTFIHFEGKWTTIGAEGDISFNFYLGQDNCSDFNVVRSTKAQIVMALSDDTTLRASWKVQLDNIDEHRVIAFHSDTVLVAQGGQWIDSGIILSPSDQAVSISADPADIASAGLEYKLDHGRLYLRSLYDGPLYPHAKLKVESWDKMLSDSITVKVSYTPGKYSYANDIPSDLMQWGCMDFSDASPEKPVTFSIDNCNWIIDKSPDSANGYHHESDNGWQFYIMPRVARVYYASRNPAPSETIYLSHWKDRDTLQLASPSKFLLKINSADISEGGNMNYNGLIDQYYDDVLDLELLSSKNGVPIKASAWKMPKDILDYKGLDASHEMDYFKSDVLGAIYFYTQCGSSSTSELGDAYFGSTVLEADEYGGLLEGLNSAAVRRYFLYGLKEIPEPSVREYDIECGIMTIFLSEKAEASVILHKCLPNGNHLGNIYNKQLELGFRQSFTAEWPGLKPYGNIDWDFRHSTSILNGPSYMAYEDGVSDIYSQGISYENGFLKFKDLDQTTFPACGGIAVCGKVFNPHSHLFISQCYTFDLVLDMPLACQVDMYEEGDPRYHYYGISIVPLTKYTTRDKAMLWNTNLITQIGVRYPDDSFVMIPSSIHVPIDPYDNANYLVLNSTVYEDLAFQAICNALELSKDHFKIEFAPGLEDQESQLFDRSHMPASLAQYADGRKGYYNYHLQHKRNDYFVQNRDLRNSLIEAYYGSFLLY